MYLGLSDPNGQWVSVSAALTESFPPNENQSCIQMDVASASKGHT